MEVAMDIFGDPTKRKLKHRHVVWAEWDICMWLTITFMKGHSIFRHPDTGRDSKNIPSISVLTHRKTLHTGAVSEVIVGLVIEIPCYFLLIRGCCKLYKLQTPQNLNLTLSTGSPLPDGLKLALD